MIPTRDSEAELLEAFQDSEERYRFLSETIPVQVWTARPDGSLDYVSEQTARIFGLTPAQLLSDGWQYVVHPEDIQRAVERWTHALADGQVYEVEFRLRTGSGAYVWHLARAVPQRNPAGVVVRWFGTNTNIEDQRAQQRRVEALVEQLREQNGLLKLESDVGAALTRPGSSKDALDACAQAVVRHMGAAFARIWTLDETGSVLELQASAGLYTHLDGAHGRIPLGAFKIGQIAAERKPHMTNQVLGDPRVSDQAWARREGMVAFVGYPILFGDKLLGVIAAFARHPLSEASLTAVGSVANRLAQALERLRAEEHVRVSEAWLSTTLSSIGDGVIATDAVGRVTFLNPVAVALTGWSVADAVGRPLETVFAIVNEDTRLVVESPVAKVLREGAIVGLANHTILVQRYGGEVAVEDSAAPIRNGQGQLTGVVLVFRDAGEKRRVDAERAHLLAQEQRARRDADAARAELHALFMQAPAPICVLRGPEHTYALANDPYQRMVGRARPLIGLPVRQALPEVAGQGFYELLDRVYTTGERFVGQEAPITFERGDGRAREEVFVTFVYEAFRDLDQRIAGILVIAFEVTDAVRARQGLQALLDERGRLLSATEDARAKADFASRAKDEFLATASHELRTPLNAILGWARLLRTGTLDPSSYLRGLETIERNANVQVQLIEDILDGSRIITGKLHLEMRSIDLTAIVRAALDTVAPAASARNITLTVSLDPEAAHVQGDPDRLQQVVWNLVNNALKFTPKGGQVEVRLDRVGTDIELAVKDNGQGISAEFLPHVFERFRQADGSTTRRHGGLGLGLALVRHLVEAHGGGVRAQSAGEGLGASFVVTLPVRAVLVVAAAAERLQRTVQSAGTELVPNSLAGVRVLVTDDELDARELVATVLRSHGAEVLLAASAQLALQLMVSHGPRVLVSDIGMPTSDGYTLIRQVRALTTEVARTPALALTAYAREEDRRRALEAGFQAYLTKPVDPEALVRLVGELAIA